MLGISQQTKYIQIIEWTLYIGLCGLSAYFMHGVLDKFFSGKTSVTQSQEPLKYLPTFMLCFSNSDLRKIKYEYGTDFIIQYHNFHNESARFISLREGENLTFMGENIHLEKITTFKMGTCYKIATYLVSDFMINSLKFIMLNFNESNIQEDFRTLEIFITSEKNSYGISATWWESGKVVKINVEKGTIKAIKLTPSHVNHLTSNSKCSYESLYECISRIFRENLQKCSPISLPSMPICKINDSNAKVFWNNWYATVEKCPKSLCSIIAYKGQELFEYNASALELDIINTTVGIRFEISNFTTSYEEYLIYDGISMIGSVGGTLGMCVGFSFTGMISFLINFLQNGFVFIKEKLLSNKKLTKSDDTNLNETLQIETPNLQMLNCRINHHYKNSHLGMNPKNENYYEDLKELEEKLKKMLDDKLEEKLEEKLLEKLNAIKNIS